MTREVKVKLTGAELIDLIMNKARRQHTSPDILMEGVELDLEFMHPDGDLRRIPVRSVTNVLIQYEEEMTR